MSRGFAAAGVGLAGLFGVLITYSTFRPELEKQRAERLGQELPEQGNDKALSQAIMSDMKEARQQVQVADTGGFAWGIRQAIWGKPEDQQNQTAVKKDEEAKDSDKKDKVG